MCGRMNITDDPTVQWLWDYFNLSFQINSNQDLCPTQEVPTMVWIDDSLQQRNCTWGIQPSWSKKPIINAQGETVHSKKTFRAAFARQRCIIPCNGWYEWRDEGGSRKQKYYFSRPDGIPLLMAGIWFEGEEKSQLVTLTTKPTQQCAEIHQRMPVLINPQQVEAWFSLSADNARKILPADDEGGILIKKSEPL